MAQVPASGVVDGDGHVLEPATLWDDYLEERFRPRGLRVRVDGRARIAMDTMPLGACDPDETARKVAGANVRRLYGIPERIAPPS